MKHAVVGAAPDAAPDAAQDAAQDAAPMSRVVIDLEMEEGADAARPILLD